MPPFSKAQIQQKFAKAQGLIKAGALGGAQEALKDLHEAIPHASEPLYYLGRIARAEGALSQAQDYLVAAHRLKPGEAAIMEALVDVQALRGDVKAAAKIHDALISLRPRHPKPLADKAIFLQQQGDFAAAERLFKKALRIAPASGELYRMWLSATKLTKDDPLIRKMQSLYAHPALPPSDRVHLGFALAKAMEETGAYDRVFGYLHKANALQRQTFPNQPEQRDREVAGIMAASPRIGPTLDSDHAPIIITGLPRSGTTLAERIIGAHDAVHPGGESPTALKLAYHLFGVPPKIAKLDEIGPGKLRDFAATYHRQIEDRVRSTSQRVTDKSIQNHLILGHLHRAMPRASLIVVRRDPRDVALSIYKNYFEGGSHRYATDLADIARYIKSFNRIVEFWKTRVPVHELFYEDLISEPEKQSRALLAFCGLDWQEQCLNFHQSRGLVKTLSIAQVRQPVYTSSVGAWRRYPGEMCAFDEAWGKTDRWV